MKTVLQSACLITDFCPQRGSAVFLAALHGMFTREPVKSPKRNVEVHKG